VQAKCTVAITVFVIATMAVGRQVVGGVVDVARSDRGCVLVQPSTSNAAAKCSRFPGTLGGHAGRKGVVGLTGRAAVAITSVTVGGRVTLLMLLRRRHGAQAVYRGGTATRGNHQPSRRDIANGHLPLDVSYDKSARRSRRAGARECGRVQAKCTVAITVFVIATMAVGRQVVGGVVDVARSDRGCVLVQPSAPNIAAKCSRLPGTLGGHAGRKGVVGPKVRIAVGRLAVGRL